MDVAVADLDLTTAEATERDQNALGVRSMAIQVDVTIAEQVRQMVEAGIAAWGQLDAAVNSVGIASGGPTLVVLLIIDKNRSSLWPGWR